MKNLIMSEQSKDDPIEVELVELNEFLLSDEAPKNCMTLSELDGFLTAIAIGPEQVTQASVVKIKDKVHWFTKRMDHPHEATITHSIICEARDGGSERMISNQVKLWGGWLPVPVFCNESIGNDDQFSCCRCECDFRVFSLFNQSSIKITHKSVSLR